jgi:Ca-activated chloride channel family protein
VYSHLPLFPSSKNTHFPPGIPLWTRGLAIAALLVALARPCRIHQFSQQTCSGVDIVLAVDISSSMLLPDFTLNQFQQTTRINAAKAVISAFIQKRKTDRIGLIAFAHYPYLVSPLTLNHPWLLKNLERLRPGIIEDGTAIGSAVTMSVNRLKDLESKSRVVVLLTDGVNNAGKISPQMAAEAAASFGTKLYTIVAGTDQFYPVDEAVLQEMAKKTGGRFYRASDLRQLEGIYDEINRLEKSEVKIDTYTEQKEGFPLFLGLALLLLFLEYFWRETVFRVLP